MADFIVAWLLITVSLFWIVLNQWSQSRAKKARRAAGGDLMTRAKHGGTFKVVARDLNHRATKWRARCSCHEEWSHATYEAAEDRWREHVHAVTGKAPKPCGDKSIPRWEAAS